MSRLSAIACLAALLGVALTSSLARAEDEPAGVDAAKAAAFNARMFAGPLGPKLTYACFVRRYDADHMARHPRQKVSAMKLLVIAGHPADESASPYSFRLGLKFRQRKGDWESSGSCSHIEETATGLEVTFGCSVECDGGGLSIALARDDSATLVSVDRVRIWKSSNPDDESGLHELTAGKDDGSFRLDRTSLKACQSLMPDRDERTAMHGD